MNVQQTTYIHNRKHIRCKPRTEVQAKTINKYVQVSILVDTSRRLRDAVCAGLHLRARSWVLSID